MLTTSEIKNLILETARSLDFDPVGVTSFISLKQGEEAIEKWVGEGRHGSMKYMEDFKRRRDRLLKEIPDAKSVICLGVNYFHSKTLDHLGLRVEVVGVIQEYRRNVFSESFFEVAIFFNSICWA